MSNDEIDIKRRRLLLGVAAGTTVILVDGVGKTALAVTSEAKPKKRLAMVIDLEKCYGCQACAIACKAQNEVPLGVFRSWVKSVESGEYPNVKLSFLPKLCNQCTNAPCVRVCPTKASHVDEDTGIVRIDQDKCIGCQYCITACPYEMRFLHPEKKVADKCDFCYDKIMTGELPACVEACPARARTFGDMNDPNSEVSKLVRDHPTRVLGEEHGTGPNVYYIGLDQVLEAAKKRVKTREEE